MFHLGVPLDGFFFKLDWGRQRKSGGSPRVLKIGPKRGAFYLTTSVRMLLTAVGSALGQDNSAEVSHCYILEIGRAHV